MILGGLISTNIDLAAGIGFLGDTTRTSSQRTLKIRFFVYPPLAATMSSLSTSAASTVSLTDTANVGGAENRWVYFVASSTASTSSPSTPPQRWRHTNICRRVLFGPVRGQVGDVEGFALDACRCVDCRPVWLNCPATVKEGRQRPSRCYDELQLRDLL